MGHKLTTGIVDMPDGSLRLGGEIEKQQSVHDASMGLKYNETLVALSCVGGDSCATHLSTAVKVQGGNSSRACHDPQNVFRCLVQLLAHSL